MRRACGVRRRRRCAHHHAAAGRQAEVAADAACSRVLEGLLPHASGAALCAFVRGCVEGESLGAICTRWGG